MHAIEVNDMGQQYYHIPAVPVDSRALFCQFKQDSCIVDYLIVPSGPMTRVYYLEDRGDPAYT